MTETPRTREGTPPEGEEPVGAPPSGGEADRGPDPTAAEPAAEESWAGAGESEADGDEIEDDLTSARRDLADLTGDLQRLQAEYLNYKRRVERDRELIRENATYAALAPIIEVLDTIDRAREHGPLEGGFKAVADQLERVVAGRGLTKFGTVGEPFDPTVHEALSHIGQDPDVEVTTCKVIAKAGYRIGDRVVRAAQVLVVDPVEPTGAEPTGDGSTDAGPGDPTA